MNITQQRQAAKGKAFNLIMKIYHPKAKFHYSNYHEEDGNYSEQRDYAVNEIVKTYLKELEIINKKLISHE